MTDTPIFRYYNDLNERCSNILRRSFDATNAQKISRSHQFIGELSIWCSLLESRRESDLLRIAAHEYQYALLALCQGHYRHAFKGLRLVLELVLQSTHLSANELELREWLANRKDTVWSVLISSEEGIFSRRFVHAFFPGLASHVSYHRSLAEVLYRECSECVHGNIPQHVPLPQDLTYSQDSFDVWYEKANIVALIAHFSLSLRYLLSLSVSDYTKLEPALTDRLGHLPEIRAVFGGPQGG